jgi:thiosulfate/3-mercaptopyruvate sulfurtransferase
MNPLVTPSWLADRLGDPGTVILDATLPPVGVTPPVDTRSRYLDMHITGAVFFDIEEFSDRSIPLPHMLPTSEAFSRGMSALGVDDRMAIVIYEQQGVFSAPRAWIDAGLPTSSGPVHRAPSKFRAKLIPSGVMDFAQIQQMIAERGQILDARSSGRFTGASPEPRPGISSGHMPGAINIPFAELAMDGRMKTADQLREIFAAKGVDMQQPITTTCGSGVTAAVIALGLEIAGADRVGLYDGSWAEYAQHPEAVIEKTN